MTSSVHNAGGNIDGRTRLPLLVVLLWAALIPAWVCATDVYFEYGQFTVGRHAAEHHNTAWIHAYNGPGGEVVIPHTVSDAEGVYTITEIGWAFYHVTNVTHVHIADTVTTIGEAAFENCSSLANIVIPDSVTHMGSGAFAACVSLANVVIGHGITSIPRYAFSGCTNLAQVRVGSEVTAILGSAFGQCTGLKKLYFHGDAPWFF